MVVSVVGYDLVDPGVELANSSVHGRCLHITVIGAPGDNTNKHPHVPFLADKRASRVTLRGKREVSMASWGGMLWASAKDMVLVLTWHEEAPEAPAQIMESVIREPQYCRHWFTVTRGRTTCCRRAGVTLPVGQEGVVRLVQDVHPAPLQFRPQVPTDATEAAPASGDTCEAFRQCLI